MMRHLSRTSGYLPLVLLAFALGACAPAAPPSPTAPPPKPTEVPKPAAKPTEAPAAQPAASPVAKPAEQPAAKPAASPAAQPATKPAEQPAAKGSPVAKPPTFDARAIEQFYQGKTVRVLVGFGPGGPSDTISRLIARHMPQFIPGKPNMIVENRPGAGSLLAINQVYKAEPQDGTVIGHGGAALPLLQLLGRDGVEFDASKMNWLGNALRGTTVCAAATRTGVNIIQDVTPPSTKQLVIGAVGPGANNYDVPVTLAATLRANIKVVQGYDSAAKAFTAIEGGEVDGYCSFLDTFTSGARHMFEGDKPTLKFFVTVATQPSSHPWMRGVPVAQTLAPTVQDRQIIDAVNAPNVGNLGFGMGPGVPPDRVAALRKALADTFADRQFRDEAQRAGIEVNPNSGEELQRIFQDLFNTPAPLVARLKEILK